MKRLNRFGRAIGLAGILIAGCANGEDPSELAGLWSSYKRFGPEIEGPLRIDDKLEFAEVGAHRVKVQRDEDRVAFDLPDQRGAFSGRLRAQRIEGHWIQPPPIQIGQRMASPLVLERTERGDWHGRIEPRASEYTFYLPITQAADGRLSTFLRNPDRNLGRFTPLQTINRQGQSLEFLGRYRRGQPMTTIAEGRYDADAERLTVFLPPWRGGSFDFSRAGSASHFHARPPGDGPWRYRPPPALDDGWPTSTLEAAGIDSKAIADMIDGQIVQPDDHISAHRVHGILIARGGRLVLEEYFHGFDRNTPHDTRSASKSVISMLVGAAQHAGIKVGPATGVYETLRGIDPNRAAEKRAMSLAHLLTMSSGFYCDDNDPDAPGNEENLQNQSAQPDWYEYTLDLPMAEMPGETAIYCSANSNLIGAVVSAVANRPLAELFADLIAEPLDVKRYYLGLQPSGEPYFGGGAQWLPRDFMKIGQVMLDGGTWQGRRVFSESWAEASTRPQVKIGDRDYGYQWWINTYPYRGGSVQAFFAAGNGGQIVMGIPELDLVIAFFGGNYSDAVLMRAQNVLIPEYILPAVAPLP